MNLRRRVEELEGRQRSDIELLMPDGGVKTISPKRLLAALNVVLQGQTSADAELLASSISDDGREHGQGDLVGVIRVMAAARRGVPIGEHPMDLCEGEVIN